jgi:hypothetical protein
VTPLRTVTVSLQSAPESESLCLDRALPDAPVLPTPIDSDTESPATDTSPSPLDVLAPPTTCTRSATLKLVYPLWTFTSPDMLKKILPPMPLDTNADQLVPLLPLPTATLLVSTSTDPMLIDSLAQLRIVTLPPTPLNDVPPSRENNELLLVTD